MTREELIQVIHRSSDKAVCPSQDCHNYKGIDGCWQCAEAQLAEYEKQVRDAILDDCIGYFSIHAKEIHKHVSARDFICDRLEQLKGE